MKQYVCMKKKKKRKRSSRVCVLERLARGAWSHGEGGGEWLGPLDCADKNGSSCERGEKPAVPLSISVFHLAAWAAVHDCHVRPIQAVQVVPDQPCVVYPSGVNTQVVISAETTTLHKLDPCTTIAFICNPPSPSLQIMPGHPR